MNRISIGVTSSVSSNIDLGEINYLEDGVFLEYGLKLID